jgi:signal transduction histidine kinase
MIALFKKIFGNPEHDGRAYTDRRMEHKPSSHSPDKAILPLYLKWDIREGKLELSEAAMELLGLPNNSNPTYAEIKRICYPEDLEHVGKTIDAILFKKRLPDFYCRIVLPCGEIKHLFITGDVVLDDNQVVVSINARLQDVTEQRLHIQKIQMQNQRLQDIAWLQSHKMRSPVATIMGLIQLFNSEDPNDPINARILEGVKEAAGNLDEVIKEINSKTETMKVAS